MVKVITKLDCPNCSRLKMFINAALNDNQKSKIEIILKEDNEELYAELVNKYNILTLPAVIHDEIMYANIQPTKLVELVSKS